MAQPPETRNSLIARLTDTSDNDAWRQFADLYEPFIYQQARRFGLQHADARELVQDVLVAVSTAVENFQFDRRRGRFRTWLYAIGRNISLQHLAKLKCRERGSGDSTVMTMLATQPAADTAESAEIGLALRRHVFLWVAQQVRGEFQPKTWMAFWQTSVENHAVDTVARSLGMSVGSVYIARSRVMARLRERVQEITLDDVPEAAHVLNQAELAASNLGGRN